MKRADIILLSENIFTASTLGMISGGVAIAGNKIELVGSKEEVLALADETVDASVCIIGIDPLKTIIAIGIRIQCRIFFIHHLQISYIIL